MDSQLPHNYFPCWSNDNLPTRRWQQRIPTELNVIPWHNCANCGATPKSKGQRVFRYCAGCYQITWRDRPRYCSFECQKKDWKARHNIECNQFRLTEVFISRQVLPMGSEKAAFRRLEIRQAVRWGTVIRDSGLLDWAARQAFHASSIKDSQNTMLRIDMASAHKHPQSPVQVQSITFQPYSGLNHPLQHQYVSQNAHLKEELNQEKIGHFVLNINGWEAARGYTMLYDPPYNLVPFCSQWLWVFSHCTLMGDINPNIAEARLDALVRTLEWLKKAAGSSDIVKLMETFDMKQTIHQMTFHDQLMISEDRLDEWMTVMFPIVGRIGGRIKLPCNTVMKRYKGTLGDTVTGPTNGFLDEL